MTTSAASPCGAEAPVSQCHTHQTGQHGRPLPSNIVNKIINVKLNLISCPTQFERNLIILLLP